MAWANCEHSDPDIRVIKCKLKTARTGSQKPQKRHLIQSLLINCSHLIWNSMLTSFPPLFWIWKIYRLPYILEMFSHCKCLSLLNFATRADTAQTCIVHSCSEIEEASTFAMWEHFQDIWQPKYIPYLKKDVNILFKLNDYNS